VKNESPFGKPKNKGGGKSHEDREKWGKERGYPNSRLEEKIIFSAGIRLWEIWGGGRIRGNRKDGNEKTRRRDPLKSFSDH